MEKLSQVVNEKQETINTQEVVIRQREATITEKDESERKIVAELQDRDATIEKRDAVIAVMRSGGAVVQEVENNAVGSDQMSRVAELEVSVCWKGEIPNNPISNLKSSFFGNSCRKSLHCA